MTPEEIQRMRQFLPMMAQAAKFAENDPGRHGVLSIKTTNPSKVVKTSVNNNFNRWAGGKQPAPWIGMNAPHPDGTPFDPKKFVDFMHRRWAPIGAENDKRGPDGEWLNKNWAPNVRWYLQNKLSPEDYEFLKRLNFVKTLGNQNRAYG